MSERLALVAPTDTGSTPVAYDLGLALGWRKFAVSGDMAKVDIAGFGRHEAVNLGVSYSVKRISARVAVGADRATGALPQAISDGSGYSVDLGTSYSLTRNIDVTAGVRYRATERDRLVPQSDDRRDSQAVYVGTAFHF